MTEYEKRINRAMNEVKKAYGHECVLSGYHCDVIVGSHIFKRSLYPQFAAVEENIIPLSVENDRLFEQIESPWERICLIIGGAHESVKDKAIKQMVSLIQFVTNELGRVRR